MNNGLKGNRRIVYEELCTLVELGKPVSVYTLADRANCAPRTVHRVIDDLESWGLIKVYYRNNRKEYQICWQN